MSITLNDSVMDSIHQTSPPRPNSDGSSGYGSYHSLDKLDDDESDVKDDTEDDKKDNKYKTRGNEGPKNIALRALLVISVLLNIVLLCFIFAFILYVKLFSEDDNDNKQWNTVNSNSYALADNCYQLSTAENHKTKTEDHPLTKHSSSAFCQYSATKYLHNLLVLVRILSSLHFFLLFPLICVFHKITENILNLFNRP